MSKFSVRCVDIEPSVQISFEYAHNNSAAREYNADRQKSELTGNTLTRISANINKQINKKAKKRKRQDGAEELEEVTVKLFESDENTPVSEDIPLVEALKHERVVMIESQKYIIDLNPPLCQKVTIPQTAMVGFPIFPQLQVEFCNLGDSEYLWEKVKYEDEKCDIKSQKPPPAKEAERSEVGTSLMYTPSNSDIGYRLSLTCTPKNGQRSGKSVTVESKFEVTAGPGFCPFENRHLYTQKETGTGEYVVLKRVI